MALVPDVLENQVFIVCVRPSGHRLSLIRVHDLQRGTLLIRIKAFSVYKGVVCNFYFLRLASDRGDSIAYKMFILKSDFIFVVSV